MKNPKDEGSNPSTSTTPWPLNVQVSGSCTFSGFGVFRTESVGRATGPATVITYHVIEGRAVPTAGVE